MDLSDERSPVAARLEADSIWLEYGQHRVLQNIYVRVDAGQVVGLLGRNGYGKSSLLEIIYGTRPAQNRSVRINGRYVDKLYQRPNTIAFLPQKSFIPGTLLVKDVFALYGSAVAQATAFFPELTSTFPQRFDRLSGGQQRLVETVLILTSPAHFALLDEPFSNVMPLHVETLKGLINTVKQQKGILLTDHYYRDVLDISDTVYVLTSGGRTVRLTEPEQQLKDVGYLR
ncbi:ATP-binding cassette domain-containing protein [Fibrisoma montanum]|uniref:ATP-binding cassette domain-containing protein n=1 Tax=Fibrisoma montanum TaxID=2305895 RepID=A0A418M6V6_9BACT|nr:ATP-binding cassette domain-containing protein [Fibrisoma montanum]RIV21536.1 ATP-binding cassette domain-containing protein [Fibrisoma montanum]